MRLRDLHIGQSRRDGLGCLRRAPISVDHLGNGMVATSSGIARAGVGGQAAALRDLPVLREYSVDRRDRADIDAIIEQAGVDLERRKIHNIGRVHDAQSPGLL